MGTASAISDKEINWKRKQIIRQANGGLHTGVDTGAPPLAEVGTTGFLALEMEQGDVYRDHFELPKDLDPNYPIGITMVAFSGSTTTSDLLTVDLLTEKVADGGSAVPATINDAPGTDFATLNPTATAYAKQRTRAEIAADYFTEAQIANGAGLAVLLTATDIDCDTNGAGEGFFIQSLILDYVPRRTKGEGVAQDIAA